MRLIRKFVIFLALIFAIFLLLDQIYPLDKAMLNRPKARILYDVNHKIIAMSMASDQIWRFETTKIPDKLKRSVLLFEDRYFYYHFGINPISIIKAAIHNTKNQNKIGASTITMQVARMMNPKQRTIKSKLIEAFNALQLELHYTKDEILNFYFNLAPYGGNIEGARAGAIFYFSKELDQLTSSQIALLTTIPKNPNANRLDRKSNVNALKNRVCALLYKNKIINLSEFKRAKDEKFTPNRLKVPNFAPQFAQIAFKNSLTNSKLNLTYQIALQELLNSVMREIYNKNVKNSAAVLIDNHDMSVVAYVASHNEKAKDGQNDGVSSVRSVGSALKPFIYALAIDQGLITPKSELVDTQLYMSGYVPKNYNNKFNGIVSAAQALNFSLNIPAISLNQHLAQNSLYEMLLGLNLVQDKKEFYGQSIVLGSSGMSLVELTRLYSAFANGGVAKNLELGGMSLGINKELFSPQSAYITAKILQNTPRIYLNSVWQNTLNMPPIAFKTGTSGGARDLISIGVSPEFSLGVWMGNFDGSKTDDLNGAISASKVVIQMFSKLSKIRNISDFKPPNRVSQKEVCVDAFGFKECKKTAKDLVIDGVNLKDTCDRLRNEDIYFMLKSGFINQNEILSSPCKARLDEMKPLIASPANGAQFIKFNKDEIKIMVKCISANSDEIYIKVDDLNYTKFANSQDIFMSLTSGEHRVSCLDLNSNLSESKFIIKEE